MENKERNSLALPEGCLLKQRYRIGDVLGAGGFGITYKAYDTLKRTYCAVKEYVPLGICMRGEDGTELLPAYSQEKNFGHGMERFLEEAAALLELAEIPNIVRLFDYFYENGTACYVMEYLQGGNLRQLQRAMPGNRLPFEEAYQILRVIGGTLDKVHRQRHLLHRDISPDNIFYTVDGRLKLIDFGSAKHLSSQGSQQFSVVLKPGFAPPEQHNSMDRQGPYTDVYALAATFYYVICGSKLPDSSERKAGAVYTPAWQLVPRMTRQMSAVLDKALHLDYRKRYQTVEQFLWELEQAVRGSEAGLGSEEGADSGEQGEEFPWQYGEQESREKPSLIPYVAWLENNQEKRIWYLAADTVYRVGRSENCSEIVITGFREISKLHCMLQYDSAENRYLVMDVSTNGTRQQGRWLKKDKVYAVAKGTRIFLAGICELEIGVRYGRKEKSG